MFDGVHDLVDEFKSHARYNPFSFRECTLESTERNPRLLGGHSREQLQQAANLVAQNDQAGQKGQTEAIAGKITESSIVVSGSSSSSMCVSCIFCSITAVFGSVSRYWSS